TTMSEFCVKKDTLKFPEGFSSEHERKTFEGLAKEIEMAAEEAAVLASKGRTPGDDCQIIPPKPREVADDFSEQDKYRRDPRVVKTNLTGPRWKNFKSQTAIQDIENRADFIKNHRFHDIIVYKVSSNGRGFVGFAPLIGSVHITATQHKTSDRRLKVGDTVATRIELNKHSKTEFVVESVVDFVDIPFAEFELIERPTTTELMLKCPDLDLREWRSIKGEKGDKWHGKKWGLVEHPVLQRVLVPEEIAIQREWAGKKVVCSLLHFEGIENQTPGKIRLILDNVLGLSEDGPIAPVKVDIPCGRPDNVESDEDVDSEDEEDREDGGQGHSYGEDGEGRGPAGSAFIQQTRSVFARNTGNNGRGGNAWPDPRGDDRRGYDTREGGGRDYEDRGRGNGRGERGVWNESASNRSSPGTWQDEGQGFGTAPQQNSSMYEKGFAVIYSMRDSYFYTRNRQVVKYEGNIENIGISLGDSAEFDMEPSDSDIPFTVVPGTIQKIPNIYPDFFKPEKIIHRDELYIRVRAGLTPQRDVFECEHISDVRLETQRQNLALFEGEFVKRTRLILDHVYDIYVRFSSDTWSWEFKCIDERAGSFVLEKEDEIDQLKRLNLESDRRPVSRSSRSGDDSSWERVQPMRSVSSNEVGHSSRSSNQPSGIRHRDDDDKPRISRPSKPPSVVSSKTSTQWSNTTMTAEKELKELRRQLARTNLMLKSVWEYKPVQQTVKTDNYFMYTSVDDYVKSLVEDESEMNKRE
ncbi:hypothetical protein PMAYCL1PPCAC_26053, partial [Pristionchus mayeri]